MRAFIILSFSCLAATAAAAQRVDTGVVHLGVPQSIGPWVFAGRHDYPDPALGVVVRYQRPDSLRVDVFAYPGPDLATRCPLACAKDVLDREVNEFVGAFPELIKRKYVDTIFVVSDTTLSPAAESAWQLGRHLVLSVVSKGAPERSDFYLYYLHGFRIKLRASYVADSSRVRGVEDFAQLVVPAMLMQPPGARPDINGASTERPKGAETEAWHGKDSPGGDPLYYGSPRGRFDQDRDREPVSDRYQLEGCEDRESTAGHERASLRWCFEGARAEGPLTMGPEA